MAFKRLIVLGGAALLIAGCSNNSPTDPVGQINGAEASARGGKKAPSAPKIAPMSMQASDSASCRTWPLPSGIIADSTCAGEP